MITFFRYALRYWLDILSLQIKFTFRSGSMIFGWVMALGLWNLAKSFFRYTLDIDLIFGIWVYNDELQIKFTFRSGPMIVGRVMALGLWNLAKYLVVTTFFRYALRYWLDILSLQIKFTFRSGSMIFGRVITLRLWNLAKSLVVTTFFSLCLEILTWYFMFTDQVYVSFRFNDFWSSYGPWTLKFCQIFSCHHFFRYAWRYWLDVWYMSV